jgi:hypothetical protein
MDERQAERVESILVAQDQIIYDLSVTGARVRIPQKLNRQNSIRVRIFSKTGLSLEALGEVKRISEFKNNVILAGLQFIDLSAAEQETLRTIVDHFGRGVAVSAQIIG